MKESEEPDSRPQESGREESFLRRWTRRKSEDGAKAEQPAHEQDESQNTAAPGPEPSVASGQEDVESERQEQEPEQEQAKGDEDMPSLESIDQGGSVADFFSPGVSEGLRRAALRRLFSQSALPVVDELDDYAGDYTKYTKLGDLVTNEMRHRLEVVRQRLEKRAEERLASAEAQSDAGSGGRSGPSPGAEPDIETDSESEPTAFAVAEPENIENTGPDAEATDEQEHSRNDRNTG